MKKNYPHWQIFAPELQCMSTNFTQSSRESQHISRVCAFQPSAGIWRRDVETQPTRHTL